jgi:hypothetical protein
VATARLAARVEGVKEDAVQIIARLLRRDRELGLVDEALEVPGREGEAVGQVARGEVREVAFGQGLQHEARAAGADLHLARIARHLERDLGTLGQFPHDVVDDVRRHGGRARGRGLRRDGLRHLDVEIRGLESQAPFVGAQEDVRQDRDRVAPLDDAMDVPERPQQRRSLDSNSHGPTRLVGAFAQDTAPGALFKEGRFVGRGGAADWRRLPEKARPHPAASPDAPYSCSMRFRSSTSSLSA